MTYFWNGIVVEVEGESENQSEIVVEGEGENQSESEIVVQSENVQSESENVQSESEIVQSESESEIVVLDYARIVINPKVARQLAFLAYRPGSLPSGIL